MSDCDRQEYTYPDGKSAGLLTMDEAREAGFCPFCGAFVAGVDSEIPSILEYGVCSDCADELREDTDWRDDGDNEHYDSYAVMYPLEADDDDFSDIPF